MKEVKAALEDAIGAPITWAQFRRVLDVAYEQLYKAVDAEDARVPFAGAKVADDPSADTGRALPGGQRVFETPAPPVDLGASTGVDQPPPVDLGVCPNCGSAIVEAATATKPAVCLACGPLT